MKVLLTAINSKFVHSNLAVRYLKAFTEDMDYECKIREFSINDRDEKILEEIIKEKANVIAFSTYIWNIFNIYLEYRSSKEIIKFNKISR